MKKNRWAEKALEDLPELLSEKQIEAINARSAQALRNDRWAGRSIFPYIKIGKNVRYRKKDVLEFLEKNTVPASE